MVTLVGKLPKREHEGAFEGDGNVLYPVLGDGHLRWHICTYAKNSSSYELKICTFYYT